MKEPTDVSDAYDAHELGAEIAEVVGNAVDGRASRLALEWPALAAKLAELCEMHEAYVPAPFRRARAELRGERTRLRPGREGR